MGDPKPRKLPKRHHGVGRSDSLQSHPEPDCNGRIRRLAASEKRRVAVDTQNGPTREVAGGLFGLRSRTVGWVAKEADGASGVLVSSQSHGNRGRGIPIGNISVRHYSERLRYKGPRYNNQRGLAIRGSGATHLGRASHRALEHIW